MARINIENLAAGMVLKDKVCDRSGRLLLPEGETLTDRHLHIFRTWGVLEAEVLGDEIPAEAEEEAVAPLDPELYAQVQKEVQALFVHNDPEHPAIKTLMRICIERKVARAL